jgi:tetratricopeptide (TPR) repeat protein
LSTTEETIGGESELKDFYENKITSITAGITETKIIEEKWNGVEYWMKAEITIDPDDIDRKVSDIVNSREKLKELEDVKKKADDALAEIKRLNKELAEVKSDADQLRLTKAYNEETDALSATDWFNKGYNADINKEYDKAISFYLKAIELDPEYAAAYWSRSIAKDALGDKSGCLQDTKKAARLGYQPAQDWLKENGYDW